MSDDPNFDYMDEDQTHEYYQDRLSDLQSEIDGLEAEIGEQADTIGVLRDQLDLAVKIIQEAYSHIVGEKLIELKWFDRARKFLDDN